MKVLWRISNHDDLTGLGGERSNGRWHTAERGKRIIYFSEHPALALIETLVNLKGNPELFPASYQLIKAEADEDHLGAIATVPRLSDQWTVTSKETQAIGDRWLRDRDTALFAVPSVPSPESVNYLLNPLHPRAGFVLKAWCKRVEFDWRLFRVREVVKS